MSGTPAVLAVGGSISQELIILHQNIRIIKKGRILKWEKR